MIGGTDSGTSKPLWRERFYGGWQLEKTHCPKGHSYKRFAVFRKGITSRYCGKCESMRDKNAAQKNRRIAMKSVKLSGKSAGKEAEIFMLTCAISEALDAPKSPNVFTKEEREKLAAYVARYVVTRRRKSARKA